MTHHFDSNASHYGDGTFELPYNQITRLADLFLRAGDSIYIVGQFSDDDGKPLPTPLLLTF